MAIKVKHDGNATATAFASAEGGKGKRAQQDAASMSQVMQSAANSSNQQLRGASAPGATPGRANAQLIHATAPAGGNAGVSGTRSGSGNNYDRSRELAQKFEYDKALKKMGIEGDLAAISRRASETRGTATWNARVNQAQHPDVPVNNAQSNEVVSPLRPTEEKATNTPPTNTGILKQPQIEQGTVDAVNNALAGLVINQPMGNGGTTIGESLPPNALQQRLNQTLVGAVNKLQRGMNPSDEGSNNDLLSKLISQLNSNPYDQNTAQQNNSVNPVEKDNGVDLEADKGVDLESDKGVDLEESDAFTKKKSLYDNDADYGFMDNIFSVV